MMTMLDWTRRAACLELDPELFFPISMEGPSQFQAEQAKQVCRGCPVREPCLEYALSTRQAYGVWGGTDPGQRREMALRAQAPPGEREVRTAGRPEREIGPAAQEERETVPADREERRISLRVAAGCAERLTVRAERKAGRGERNVSSRAEPRRGTVRARPLPGGR